MEVDESNNELHELFNEQKAGSPIKALEVSIIENHFVLGKMEISSSLS